MHRWLVALQTKDVIRILLDDALRDALLAADRVDADDRAS
jgi:hypothetical protein